MEVTPKGWDESSSSYDFFGHFTVQYALSALDGVIGKNPQPGLKVLDIATGTGQKKKTIPPLLEITFCSTKILKHDFHFQGHCLLQLLNCSKTMEGTCLPLTSPPR